MARADLAVAAIFEAEGLRVDGAKIDRAIELVVELQGHAAGADQEAVMHSALEAAAKVPPALHWDSLCCLCVELTPPPAQGCTLPSHSPHYSTFHSHSPHDSTFHSHSPYDSTFHSHSSHDSTLHSLSIRLHSPPTLSTRLHSPVETL